MSQTHKALEAKQEADEKAAEEVAEQAAQNEADLQARMESLAEEAKQREDKARLKQEKLLQEQAEADHAKKLLVVNAYQEILDAIIKPIEIQFEDGSECTWRAVGVTWQEFWEREYVGFKRHMHPNDYTDYSEEVVAEARQLMTDGVSDDTDVVLQLALEQDGRRVIKKRKEAAIAIAKAFEVNQTEEMASALRLRIPGGNNAEDVLIHPLVLQAMLDNYLVMEAMLPHCRSEPQTEAFIAAAGLGHEKIVSKILEKCVLLKNSVPFALSEASKNGHLAVVKLIVNTCHDKLHGVCRWPAFSEHEKCFGVVENAVHQAIDADHIEILQCLLTQSRSALMAEADLDEGDEPVVQLGGMSQAERLLMHAVSKDAPVMTYALLDVFPHLLDQLDKHKLDKQGDIVRRRVRYCLWHNNLANMRGQPPHRPDMIDTCLRDLHIQHRQPETNDRPWTTSSRYGTA